MVKDLLDKNLITGYIHVATIGRWQSILSDQVNVICQSGLDHVTNQICVGKVGADVVHLPSAWNLIYESNDLLEYEFPTLQYLYHSSMNRGFSWYIHLKGASKTQEDFDKYSQIYKEYLNIQDLETLQQNEDSWRQYMEYFVVTKYKKCIELLDNHDVCGVQWRIKPHAHFSGNFWWARNDYIRQLKSPYEFRQSCKYLDKFNTDRTIAEFWIGSGNPKVAVLWNDPRNLFSYKINTSDYKELKIF